MLVINTCETVSIPDFALLLRRICANQNPIDNTYNTYTNAKHTLISRIYSLNTRICSGDRPLKSNCTFSSSTRR